jgi:O-antigen ligase
VTFLERACTPDRGIRSLETWQLVAFLLLLAASYQSIAVSQITLGLALALTVARWLFCRQAPPRTGLEKTAALLAGWALLTIPFSTAVSQSILYYRRFYLFTVIWIGASLATTEFRRLMMAGVFFASALVISLWSQVHTLQVSGSFFGIRMAEISNPMTSGALMMMVSLLAMGFLMTRGHSRRLKVVIGLVLIPLLVALIQTMTRSAFLGLFAGVGTLVLLTRPRLYGRLMIAALLLVVFLVTAGEHVLAPSLWERIEPENTLSGTSTRRRLDMWQGGLEMVKAHPVVGVGDRGLEDIAPEYYDPADKMYFGHLHSNFIHMAVIWGLPGLAFGLAFTFAPLLLLWRRWKRLTRAPDSDRAPPVLRSWVLGALGVWTGFFVAGWTEWYFGDAESMLVYLAILGIALGSWPTDAQIPEQENVAKGEIAADGSTATGAP